MFIQIYGKYDLDTNQPLSVSLSISDSPRLIG